jgi:hypothetical protein
MNAASSRVGRGKGHDDERRDPGPMALAFSGHAKQKTLQIATISVVLIWRGCSTRDTMYVDLA